MISKDTSPDVPAAPQSPKQFGLLAGMMTLKQIADDLDCTERAVYKLVDRHNIPFIKVLNRRYLDPLKIKVALLSGVVDRQPRGRGRPRKQAA